MKNIILALAFIVVAPAAFATGLTCPNFPYDMTAEDGVKELRTVEISETTVLTALQKTQVIAMARWSARMNGDTAPRAAKAAVTYLKDNSEAGDLSYIVLRFEGQVYTQILSYPGGNPYGLIFKGSKAIAQQTDGDVNCL